MTDSEFKGPGLDLLLWAWFWRFQRRVSPSSDVIVKHFSKLIVTGQKFHLVVWSNLGFRVWQVPMAPEQVYTVGELVWASPFASSGTVSVKRNHLFSFFLRLSHSKCLQRLNVQLGYQYAIGDGLEFTNVMKDTILWDTAYYPGLGSTKDLIAKWRCVLFVNLCIEWGFIVVDLFLEVVV